MAEEKRVLFVCVENAGRSQMAEAFANHHGRDLVIARSAGTMIAEEVNPLVIQVMREKGIDVSKNRPKTIDIKEAAEADLAVTMGCSVQDVCPAPLLKNALDWELADPKGKPIEEVRKIRDEIERRVLQLLKEIR